MNDTTEPEPDDTVAQMVHAFVADDLSLEAVKLHLAMGFDPVSFCRETADAFARSSLALAAGAFGFDIDEMGDDQDPRWSLICPQRTGSPPQEVLAERRRLDKRISDLERALRSALESGIANPQIRNRLNDVLAGEPKSDA